MDVNNPQDIARKRKLQMDLIIKEGEFKKGEQLKSQIEFKIRETKKKISLLEVGIMADKKEIERLESDQANLSGEIKKVKREISEI